MKRLKKQKAHLTNLWTIKRQHLLAQPGLNSSDTKIHAVHWEGLIEDEESNIEISNIANKFCNEVDNTVDILKDNI
jgi:hypothetical protein